MMGLPFRICAYDTETGVFRSATPYPNVDAIVALWGGPLSGVEDLGEVRDLESYEAFPAWDFAAAQRAAGVHPHPDPRRRA